MKLRQILLLSALATSWWATRDETEGERFTTSRESAVALALADEDDSFTFAVFGDRTGGPADGVKVLAQAVADVNLIDPDLVMTVGDLVQGYNRTLEWKQQADEFSGIMNRLTSPWYPVAGNHDVYWRGKGRPAGEHDGDYERHFGPLWYAFRHKDCWFIALYSDEGNPLTGEKDFNQPACQRMSQAQFEFLAATLTRAKAARHVFVFLHHPRWQGGQYGDDWERVHALLAKAGNVTAVFAGHIHHMVYDGVRDGIEYFTLATVGGAQAGDAPEAGYLHQWNLVTVRDGGLAVSTFPVGAALDPRLITGEVARAARRLIDDLRPSFSERPTLHLDRALDEEVVVELPNPTNRPIEVSLALESPDARWIFAPDHGHLAIPAGESREFSWRALREAGSIDASFRAPVAQLRIDYLAETHRVSLPARVLQVPLDLNALPEPEKPRREVAFEFDGKNDCLSLAHADLALPDGPFTLECWLQGHSFNGRRGLINKTESSEFGLFVSDGVPRFVVHLSGTYVEARASDVVLQTKRWYHIAGVFDGREVRLYLDGKLLAATPGSGKRGQNALPLLIGADVDHRGLPDSLFDGLIDEVRLSTVARYAAKVEKPLRRQNADQRTQLLLHLDERVGIWAFDSASEHRHASLVGRPKPVPAE